MRAAAKGSGIGRDGAEAGIPLFGAVAKAVKGLFYAGLIARCYGTIESGFVLEQHILLGHAVARTLLQRHRIALLFLQIIVLLLEYAAPFGEVGKGILLGLYVTHRNGGVCCLFGKPFVDGLYLRVKGEQLFFEIKEGYVCHVLAPFLVVDFEPFSGGGCNFCALLPLGCIIHRHLCGVHQSFKLVWI